MSQENDKGLNQYLKSAASNIKVIYGTMALIVGLLATSITFITKTSSQEARIEILEESREELGKQVSSLNGTLGTVNEAVKIFLHNSPALLDHKLTELGEKVDKYHSEPAIESDSPSIGDFENRPPE